MNNIGFHGRVENLMMIIFIPSNSTYQIAH